ncbi:MAG: class I SAM-dependent methyltransferase [Kouleothrix sp.]|jgi:2-polyprenyl-3-methyl-5-hydroxy-6-metoxy-1,4-benzoquinol methylase|nr:class I SAM-dependent methyltransferase [Kouleothrix sp.]
MATVNEQSDLLLGEIAGRPIRLSPQALRIAREHAGRIALSLGSHDPESSLAGYWSLGDRLAQWQRIVDRIGLAAAQRARLLEVGCGMGLFTLAGAALGFEIVGAEASSDRYADSLRVARALCADNGFPVALVQAFGERLPLPSQSVDFVVSFQTLEHVADVAQTLREVRRVLRPGGTLFAQAPNYTGFYEAHYGVLLPLGLGKALNRQLLRLYRRPRGFIDHLQWLSPARLRTLLRELGFASFTVGPIAPTRSRAALLPGQAYPLPFQHRRGAAAERLANRLAGAYHRATGSPDRYTQLEIWATA